MPSEFTSSVIDAVKNKNNEEDFGKQSNSFIYKMKAISSYNESKFAFGANVNILQIFSIGADYAKQIIENKSLILVDVSQTFYHVIMDTPKDGNIFKTKQLRNKYLSKNPVYVNVVNYGRKAVLIVESNESTEKIMTAIRAGFKAKIVNGSINLDANTEKILREAMIKIFIAGGKGNDAVNSISGFKEFKDYITKGKIYDKVVYGVPISFGAAYASNNEIYENEFSLKKKTIFFVVVSNKKYWL